MMLSIGEKLEVALQSRGDRQICNVRESYTTRYCSLAIDPVSEGERWVGRSICELRSIDAKFSQVRYERGRFIYVSPSVSLAVPDILSDIGT